MAVGVAAVGSLSTLSKSFKSLLNLGAAVSGGHHNTARTWGVSCREARICPPELSPLLDRTRCRANPLRLLGHRLDHKLPARVLDMVLASRHPLYHPTILPFSGKGICDANMRAHPPW